MSFPQHMTVVLPLLDFWVNYKDILDLIFENKVACD